MPTETAAARPCIVSFPKSGRTWLVVMLDEAGVAVDFDHAGSEHRSRKHFAELSINDTKARGKIVLLTRDPRDTAVSGYHQATKRARVFEGTIGDFIRDPRHGIEKIARFNLMWLKHARQRTDVLACSYEELQSDTAATLRKIVSFIGGDVEPDRLAAVAADNAFSNMQTRERTGFYADKYGSRLAPGDVEDVSTYKVRRGIVGGYMDELNPDDVAYADDLLAELNYFPRVKELSGT